jgi:DHA2 family multidrug resistance protein
MYWPSLSLVTLGPLPREDMGAGTGFYNLTRLLGGSFGIALLAVIFDQRRSLHRSNLVEHLTVTNPLLQERLSQLQALVLERGEGPGRVADQALQLLSDQVGRQASLLAFSDVFRVVGLLFLLALPLVLLTGGRGRSEAGGGALNLVQVGFSLGGPLLMPCWMSERRASNLANRCCSRFSRARRPSRITSLALV